MLSQTIMQGIGCLLAVYTVYCLAEQLLSNGLYFSMTHVTMFRGGSRISEKGVHKFKGEGVHFAEFSLFFF